MAERIYLSPPDVSETERRLLLDAFDSNWISPLGPHVDAFEREFAACVQMPHAVALSSGTAALHLALMVVGVRPGDAVIVPTLTFAATANVVSYIGGEPVFVDVSPESWTIDPGLLEEELRSRRAAGQPVGAVMTVDLYGQCADYAAIESICRKYSVPLVEDAAEALGATYADRQAGQFGACAAFSFNSNKVITTGGGGMLVSHDRALVERVRYLSTQARDPVPHYQHAEVGFNYRMSNLLAAVGRGQLASLSQKLERRRQISARYRQALSGRPGFEFMPEARYGRSSCWLTALLIDPTVAGISRNEIRDSLERLNIESRPVWKPMHLQPAFNRHVARGGEVAAGLFENGLCLPSGSSLTESQQERVIAGIVDACDRRWFPESTTGAALGRPPDDHEATNEPAPAVLTTATPIAGQPAAPSLWRRVLRFHRAIAIGAQLTLMVASYLLALLLRFDFSPPDWAWASFRSTLPVLVLFRSLIFIPFRLYQGLWRYTGMFDLERLAAGVLCSTAVFAAFVLSPFGPVSRFPRSILITDTVLLFIMLSGIRMSRRVYQHLSATNRSMRRRVLVVGAGSGGEMIAREMRVDPSLGFLPVGFIDDDAEKVGLSIHGVRVLGTRDDLSRIVAQSRADEFLIAMPGADIGTVNSIVRSLEPHKLPIKTLPPLRNIIHGRVELNHIRTLAVEDLISRQASDLDPAPVKRMIQNRHVVVTGAGGVIGGELCRQIIRWQPSELTLIDRHENSLLSIASQLRDRRPRAVVTTVLLDVLDADATTATFSRLRPDVVFHAASGKDVALAESHPIDAYRGNVHAAHSVISAASDAGAERCVVLSSDKAAASKNVLGRTKRMAEWLVRLTASESPATVCAVRFGNVIGAAGSVVARFVEQVQNGGPVSVTHPEARRAFMLMPEAVSLVLHAAAISSRGDVTAVNMGEPVRILDLATRLIRLAGLVPNEDIRIEITGLRPGETVQDETLGENERSEPLGEAHVVRVVDAAFSEARAAEALAELDVLIDAGDSVAFSSALAQTIYPAEAAQSIHSPGATPIGVVESLRASAGAPCPKCGGDLHRSKGRRLDQQLRKRLSLQRLFRCHACGWRGWLEPSENGSVQSVQDLAGSPAADFDLSALDGDSLMTGSSKAQE